MLDGEQLASKVGHGHGGMVDGCEAYRGTPPRSWINDITGWFNYTVDTAAKDHSR